jgi:hypothetical protein
VTPWADAVPIFTPPSSYPSPRDASQGREATPGEAFSDTESSRRCSEGLLKRSSSVTSERRSSTESQSSQDSSQGSSRLSRKERHMKVRWLLSHCLAGFSYLLYFGLFPLLRHNYVVDQGSLHGSGLFSLVGPRTSPSLGIPCPSPCTSCTLVFHSFFFPCRFQCKFLVRLSG